MITSTVFITLLFGEFLYYSLLRDEGGIIWYFSSWTSRAFSWAFFLEQLWDFSYVSIKYLVSCYYSTIFNRDCFDNLQMLTFLPLLFLQELFYEDRHYHAHCFRCFRCDRSLADEPFTSQGDALVCSDCYCNEFSSKCAACDKIVMPGSDNLFTLQHRVHRAPWGQILEQSPSKVHTLSLQG